MTTQEFSNEFDILYNNIMSNAAPGLNEYEKSVFLTKAQDEIVKAYFNPKGNKFHEGYDDSAKRQIDFSMLTAYSSFKVEQGAEGTLGYKTFLVPFISDALMVLNETIIVTRSSKNIVLTIVPISYLELSRVMSKPYKYPLKWQAWRIIGTSTDLIGTDNIKAEIIIGPNDTVNSKNESYKMRYIKRPSPIILEDLGESGLSIGGKTVEQTCLLDPEIHHEILQRAVELAKAAYIGDLSSQLALGFQSETEKGIVAQSK